MDSLDLAAALDAANASTKYWQDLAAINAEQIAGLREELARGTEYIRQLEAGCAERDLLEENRKFMLAENFHLTADLAAARKELGEARLLIREAHAMLVDLWVLAGPALPDDDTHKSVDKTVSGLSAWLSDFDSRHGEGTGRGEP